MIMSSNNCLRTELPLSHFSELLTANQMTIKTSLEQMKQQHPPSLNVAIKSLVRSQDKALVHSIRSVLCVR